MEDVVERGRLIASTGTNHAILIGQLCDEIEKLRERCEAYKGQVKAGSDEIERLRSGAYAAALEDAARKIEAHHDCVAMEALAKEVRALSPSPSPVGLREALEKIRRTPSMPFPDLGAHSPMAWGQAVHQAWLDIQRIAGAALQAHQDGSKG